ncbi:uncharacterized protein METZ01_LOCUS479454 [marine metagenome]|uniref:Uncharacterized protein n=1 Tax=marine metagenome TaxID=408172 RepID=A0A383C3K9_9ZZZZ
MLIYTSPKGLSPIFEAEGIGVGGSESGLVKANQGWWKRIKVPRAESR